MTLTSMARACQALDQPQDAKPCAPRRSWPHIHAAFKRGADTQQIAEWLGLTEPEVANALHAIREGARA